MEVHNSFPDVLVSPDFLMMLKKEALRFVWGVPLYESTGVQTFNSNGLN